MGKAEPLFKRITEDEIKVLKEKFGGVQEKKAEEQKVASTPVEAKAKPKKTPKSNESAQVIERLFFLIKKYHFLIRNLIFRKHQVLQV